MSKFIWRSLWGAFVFSTIRSKLIFLAGIALFVVSTGTIVARYAFSLRFGEALWWTWTHMLDPGFLIDDHLGWSQKALGSLLCLSGLAVIVSGFLVVASEAAMSAFEKAVKGRVPYKMKSHTVIAGSGSKLSHFLQVLGAVDSTKSDNEVAVVVPDAGLLVGTRNALRNDAIVTFGEIWKPDEQKRLSLHHASRLLILDNFGGDSGHMLETVIGLAKTRQRKQEQEMKVYAEVSDRDLLPVLQASVRSIHGKDANMEVQLMNMADASARIALREHPLDCERINKGSCGKVVLVVIGWSQFGDALFQQVLRNGHYSVKPTRIILIGPNGDKLRRQIRESAPGLEQVEHVRLILSVEFFPDFVSSALGLMTEDMVTLAFCGEKPDGLLAQAIKFSGEPFPGLRQILVELPDGSGYWEVLKRGAFENRGIKILPVGSHATAFELAEKLDEPARSAHERYLEEKIREGKRTRTPDGQGYEDESHYDWEDLDEIHRGWNRSPADHAAVKLRALADFHGVSRPTADGENINPLLISRFAEFKAHLKEKREGRLDDLELLSRMEHDRWTGEKIAEGWLFGEKKDTDRKHHNDLVPYEKLSEAVKQYDRNQVVEQLEKALGS